MLYTEDDDDYLLVQQKLRLLRFKHNKAYSRKVNPVKAIEELQALLDLQKESAEYAPDVEYVRKHLEIVKCEWYTGTTAYLFSPDGTLLCDAITKIHPRDSFCRLTGRQVAQQKILACVGELNVPDYIKAPIISKINQNPKALPLDW